MSDPPVPLILAIYASPRQGGNSDTLLDEALRGVEEGGAAVERIYLRELSFSACQNCGYCTTHGECRLKDGMVRVYDAIERADIILLAAPIYFCSLCAQAKAMVDRCQPYWARKYVLKEEARRSGQRGGFICCGGFKDDRFLACTEQIVKTWYFILRARYAGCLFVPGLDARGDALRHRSAISDAFQYGGDLLKAQ